MNLDKNGQPDARGLANDKILTQGNLTSLMSVELIAIACGCLGVTMTRGFFRRLPDFSLTFQGWINNHNSRFLEET